jgi:cob(I)alamin adenosyltransferase
MTGSYDERTRYIHEAREFVRTDKDQEILAEVSNALMTAATAGNPGTS